MRPQTQLPSTFIFITVTHISSPTIPIVNRLMLSLLASPLSPAPGAAPRSSLVPVPRAQLMLLLPWVASGVDQAAALLRECSLLPGGSASSTIALVLRYLLGLEDVKLLLKTSLRKALGQAAQSNGVSIPGGVQKTCGCGTWECGLAVIAVVVLG